MEQKKKKNFRKHPSISVWKLKWEIWAAEFIFRLSSYSHLKRESGLQFFSRSELNQWANKCDSYPFMYSYCCIFIRSHWLSKACVSHDPLLFLWYCFTLNAWKTRMMRSPIWWSIFLPGWWVVISVSLTLKLQHFHFAVNEAEKCVVMGNVHLLNWL